MADWRNRAEQIFNKIKFQLNAKGVDNVVQLQSKLQVSSNYQFIELGPTGIDRINE
jgi:hypothetical protein